ncbi:DUF4382 domain-containing protein [Paraherbaspirillum soli]|uniref:DUF4382 domain-containing protein n=1 Tax=Paraherbaspirillum soli TaxID=631222 RepID=A0ABW0M8N0_9BURK
MKYRIRLLCLSAAISAAALLAACGGGGSASGSFQGAGGLSVALTDAPSCGFDAVNVTVNKVRAHQSAVAGDNDPGWADITLNPARKINLLDLTNGVLEQLGQVNLVAGHYTQLRLVLDPNLGSGFANSVVPAGTVNEISLDTPSSVQSGVKLGNQFDVVSGLRTDLVLDFDACKSIVQKGNGGFALKPVVKVIPTDLNGIDGFINPALLNNHVMVTAQQNGTVVRSTAPDMTTGEFLLARLAPGNYDVVITADNSASTVIANVPVTSTTGKVVVSSANVPINLQSAATAAGIISGTVTLNPASATEIGYVAAKQSFAAGPTVTIKYQGANVTTGAYALNLPTAAPQLGQFSTNLPIVFATQTNTRPGTGKYALEASANGYLTISNPSVDITNANQSGINFTLTP